MKGSLIMKNETYITVKELAERWRWSRPSVVRYLKIHEAKVVQLGRNILVPSSEVARLEGDNGL